MNGRARWTDVRVHESLRFDGPTETFAQPFIHLNNPTLVHKHLKTLRYAELKARDWLDRGKPAQMWLTPFVHVSAFLKDYVLRLAFLDGWRGYVVSQVAASYAVYKLSLIHISEPTRLLSISYAVFCLKK